MATGKARRAQSYRKMSRLRKFFREMGKRDNELTREVRETIERLARETHGVMVQQAGDLRDTGAMIDSIKYVVRRDGLTAYIGPGVKGHMTVKNKGLKSFDTRSKKTANDKAINFSKMTKNDRFQMMKAYWHEYGTKKMKARPFVGPTRDIMYPKARTEIDQAVSKAFAKMREKYK